MNNPHKSRRWKTLAASAIIAPILGVTALSLASPSANAVGASVPAATHTSISSPVIGPVTYDCKTQSLNFEIAYPANHVTIDWSTPDGGGVSASFAVAKTAPFTEPMTLADGPYTLGVTEYPVAGQPGVDFSQKFTVACAPSPSVSVSPTNPTCVTLTSANIKDYGTLTGDQKTYETITLKGKVTDYCNDFSFSGVGYDISNPANIWTPPQIVALVNSKVVGKSGLTATATVPATTCGQNDWYEGTGPAIGDKLAGPGQGYEATHKFLGQLFNGPNTWYQNISGCKVATETPSPSATETPTNPTTTPTNPTTTPTATTSVPTASTSSSTAVAVAVATCSAGKVLSSGQCVVPGVPDTGQGGTSLETTIGNVTPWSVAALVLGAGVFFLYRRSRV